MRSQPKHFKPNLVNMIMITPRFYKTYFISFAAAVGWQCYQPDSADAADC